MLLFGLRSGTSSQSAKRANSFFLEYDPFSESIQNLCYKVTVPGYIIILLLSFRWQTDFFDQTVTAKANFNLRWFHVKAVKCFITI